MRAYEGTQKWPGEVRFANTRLVINEGWFAKVWYNHSTFQKWGYLTYFPNNISRQARRTQWQRTQPFARLRGSKYFKHKITNINSTMGRVTQNGEQHVLIIVIQPWFKQKSQGVERKGRAGYPNDGHQQPPTTKQLLYKTKTAKHWHGGVYIQVLGSQGAVHAPFRETPNWPRLKDTGGWDCKSCNAYFCREPRRSSILCFRHIYAIPFRGIQV